jgi:hypothetical protein
MAAKLVKTKTPGRLQARRRAQILDAADHRLLRRDRRIRRCLLRLRTDADNPVLAGHRRHLRTDCFGALAGLTPPCPILRSVSSSLGRSSRRLLRLVK